MGCRAQPVVQIAGVVQSSFHLMGLKSVSVWAGLKMVPATIWARRAQSPHRSGVSARTKLHESPQVTHTFPCADSSRCGPLVAFITKSSAGVGVVLEDHRGASAPARRPDRGRGSVVFAVCQLHRKTLGSTAGVCLLGVVGRARLLVAMTRMSSSRLFLRLPA